MTECKGGGAFAVGVAGGKREKKRVSRSTTWQSLWPRRMSSAGAEASRARKHLHKIRGSVAPSNSNTDNAGSGDPSTISVRDKKYGSDSPGEVPSSAKQNEDDRIAAKEPGGK